MRKDRHLAIKLRKMGKSYNEISKTLNLPKTTLSSWFKNEKWSKIIKKELNDRNIKISRKRILVLSKINKKRWEEWRKRHRIEATKEFETLKKVPLFIAGINLYWGEGDSNLKNGIVRLANTDHRMVIAFGNFLQKICKIPKEKIRIYLVLYPDLSDTDCKNFWGMKTGIPISQFHKSQFIKGKHPSKRLERGICSIQVSSRGLKEKIFTWIDLQNKNLL